MELLQLKYFQTVARLEHLTKAAQELHIAQPALSKTISRLEKDLGVPLFDRQKRQIQLNTFGHIFLKQVDIALSALEEGRRQIADQAELERGRVVIASTNHQCDAELVGSFLSQYPENNLFIKQTSSEKQNVKLLQDGEIDFFITSLTLENKDIDRFAFVTEEIFLAVPSNHQLADRQSINLTEVTNESFISLKVGDHFRELTSGFCKEAGFVPNISCEVDEIAAISSFVQTGIGVAFLTKDALQKNSSLILLPIEQPICQRTFQIAWLRKRYLSRAARMFRDFLMNYYFRGA
ncbi:LysR family transcriptional regulator [Pseudalkalibacillus salsuginis]|uniref:LysR family transcriptional regulator n=1 Tax=Pseudalkalibacillus salsuginis TaxID=2910972 RepID=UPI001F3DF159|nr:LysR family transcriptional regulator [Pseudalkalibacillus salsuginis]MCF6410293.1 LysR family transcriptional regulator [Pseudalkalibacillus salsuginis]